MWAAAPLPSPRFKRAEGQSGCLGFWRLPGAGAPAGLIGGGGRDEEEEEDRGLAASGLCVQEGNRAYLAWSKAPRAPGAPADLYLNLIFPSLS